MPSSPAFRAASSARRRTSPVDQMLNHVLEDRCVQLVSNLLPVAFRHYEAGIAKHRKVPRDGRPARVESDGYVSRRQRPVAEQPEDLPPRLVSQRAERLVRAHAALSCSCIVSKLANYHARVKGHPWRARKRGLSASALATKRSARSESRQPAGFRRGRCFCEIDRMISLPFPLAGIGVFACDRARPQNSRADRRGEEDHLRPAPFSRVTSAETSGLYQLIQLARKSRGSARISQPRQRSGCH